MLKDNALVANFFGETIPLNDVRFFFIFCPNNSGTTVLSQYLASQIDSYLPPFGNFEGQMAPGVKEILRARPWVESEKPDWNFIRKYWEGLAAGKTFVEASPPNLTRPDQIRAAFGQDSTALVSICNPYQYISSCVRRYSHDIQRATNSWIRRARKIIQIREGYPFFPFISYENFVADPKVVNAQLGIPCKDAVVAGKQGSGLSDIRSGYYRAVGFLKPEDVGAIDEVLEKDADVMAYFGYAQSGPDLLHAARTREPMEFMAGAEIRARWDCCAMQGSQNIR